MKGQTKYTQQGERKKRKRERVKRAKCKKGNERETTQARKEET
jgi:hypothetical protein